MIGASRRAVSVLFFVNGLVLASWVASIPYVKARHALDEGLLGLVLLAMGLGAVVALPLGGWIVARLGSRFASAAAAIAFCLVLPLLLWGERLELVIVALALFGVLNGTLDIAMNTQAVEVERAVARPIMSSFHALFSLGGVAGAAVAALAPGRGVEPQAHVLGIAAAAMLAVAVTMRDLLPSSACRECPPALNIRPPRALVPLGLLALLGLLAEGAVADWSAVYTRESLDASATIAAYAFGAFSMAMAAGRLAGGALARRLGRNVLLRASATVAAAGLAGSLVVGHPAVAVVGFGLVGLGIANIIPLLFSAAAAQSGLPTSTALAAVASIGYLGYLAGPPLIGLVAHVIGLAGGLGIVCVACAIVAVSSRVVGDSRRVTAPSDIRGGVVSQYSSSGGTSHA